MKKLFLSLFVMGALTFGLQSCGEDDPTEDCTTLGCPAGQECVNGACQTIVVACDFCGDYSGTATTTQNIAIPALSIDTGFVDLPVDASISQGTGTNYTLTVDLSSLIPGVAPAVGGTLSGNTITITDAEYVYQGIATIIVNGTVDVSVTDAISGSLVLSYPPSSSLAVSGAIDFEGTK